MSKLKIIDSVDLEGLIEFGFIKKNDVDIAFIRPNKDGNSNTFIKHNRNVVSWSEEDIQDLIDAGLVEKVEE